jgi:hypothetical protein
MGLWRIASITWRLIEKADTLTYYVVGIGADGNLNVAGCLRALDRPIQFWKVRRRLVPRLITRRR